MFCFEHARRLHWVGIVRSSDSVPGRYAGIEAEASRQRTGIAQGRYAAHSRCDVARRWRNLAGTADNSLDRDREFTFLHPAVLARRWNIVASTLGYPDGAAVFFQHRGHHRWRPRAFSRVGIIGSGNHNRHFRGGSRAAEHGAHIRGRRDPFFKPDHR